MLIGAFALLLNRRLPGVWLILIGFALNFAVIVLNGGHMSVSATALDLAGLPSASGGNTGSVPITDRTLLWWLGDVIPTPNWFPFKNVFSIGDIFTTLGGALFIQCALVRSPSVSATTK